MSRDYIDLGSAPAEEDCAQVGAPDYHARARPECVRYMDLLRKTFGPEPEGARLSIKSNPHDFGSYLSVVCQYETTNEASVEYAYRCEDEMPRTWEAPVPEGDQQVTPASPRKICSSCMEAMSEEVGEEDSSTLEEIGMMLGGDMPDHLCDAREAPEVGLDCGCACQRR